MNAEIIFVSVPLHISFHTEKTRSRVVQQNVDFVWIFCFLLHWWIVGTAVT